MFANIIILALLGLAIVDGFGCSPRTSSARRGKIHKMWARGCERAQETRSLKERRATTKFFRKVFANAGILTGTFLPGRAVAAQRVPAALEAKENKARQNPRDVWSGARRGIMSEKPSSTTTAKIPLYNSGVGKVSATGTFVRDAVRSVGSSVVRIDCEREVTPVQMMLQPGFYQEGDTVKISGSGFVASTDGFILTNQHVVAASKKTTVSLANGRTYKCRVVAEDELTDLAVLKLDIPRAEAEQLTTAPIGDSSSLQSGDWVIAVGCPVGLDFSCSLGIVSSPVRSAGEIGATHLKGTYIQTDAALNSGNSGGPLVNDAGEVVGINTMVRTNTEAIGFAIPINRARKIYEVLKQGKKPTHAFFGVEVSTITPDFAHIHNDDPNAQRLPEVHGALVRKVLPGSPAALSGLRRNDIIVEVNGQAVSCTHDADLYLDICVPGSAAKIKVARGEGGQVVDLQATPLNVLTILEDRRRRRVAQPPAAFANRVPNVPKDGEQKQRKDPRTPGDKKIMPFITA